jgi:hypothetical protein
VGPLNLPSSGPIYIDANVLIYSIERIAPYTQALDAFFLARGQHTTSYGADERTYRA